ncbi:hypothetical protein OAF86_04045 [Flavobacteriaceae bacterium]|nr:hypothetical protein [Flavobacteriaceae bacterium]
MKTKTKNIKEKKGLSVTSDKNPNQYNGEILDDQNSRIKNSKQVFIESCVRT